MCQTFARLLLSSVIALACYIAQLQDIGPTARLRVLQEVQFTVSSLLPTVDIPAVQYLLPFHSMLQNCLGPQ